jgi:hypothetical protein
MTNPNWGFLPVCNTPSRHTLAFVNVNYIQAVKDEINQDGTRLIHVQAGDSWYTLDLPANTDYPRLIGEFFPVFGIPTKDP